MRDLNILEQEIVDELGAVWNKYLTLHAIHPGEDKDFMFHVHCLQRIVMSRPAIEKEKEDYETGKHGVPRS